MKKITFYFLLILGVAIGGCSEGPTSPSSLTNPILSFDLYPQDENSTALTSFVGQVKITNGTQISLLGQYDSLTQKANKLTGMILQDDYLKSEICVVFNDKGEPAISYAIENGKRSDILQTYEWLTNESFIYTEYQYDWDKNQGAIKYESTISTNNTGFTQNVIKPYAENPTNYENFELSDEYLIAQDYENTPVTTDMAETFTNYLLNEKTLSLIHLSNFSETDYKTKFGTTLVGFLGAMWGMVFKKLQLDVIENQVLDTPNYIDEMEQWFKDLKDKPEKILEDIKTKFKEKKHEVLESIRDSLKELEKTVTDAVKSEQKDKIPYKVYEKVDFSGIEIISGYTQELEVGVESKPLLILFKDINGNPVSNAPILWKIWENNDGDLNYLGKKIISTNSGGTCGLTLIAKPNVKRYIVEAIVAGALSHDNLWVRFDLDVKKSESLAGTWNTTYLTNNCTQAASSFYDNRALILEPSDETNGKVNVNSILVISQNESYVENRYTYDPTTKTLALSVKTTLLTSGGDSGVREFSFTGIYDEANQKFTGNFNYYQKYDGFPVNLTKNCSGTMDISK